MIKRIIFLILVTFPAFGQLQQKARFEQEIKRSENGFTIVPADSLGLFLFQETNDFEGRDRKWKLVFLNDDLEKQWEETVLINDRYSWIGHEYHSNKLYLLFRQGDYNESDLHVLRINLPDAQVKTFDISNEIDFNITLFSVCNNSALMGGYVDQRPTLIIYDFENEKVKAVPGFYLKNATLLDITVNINNTFNVLIYNEKNPSERSIELKVFDPQGYLLAEDIFSVPEGKKIMSGLTSRLENENLVITGTFGGNNSKLAEGLFWARADLSKDQALKLVPFISFNSIYDHLPERRRERLKEKAEKKAEKDRFFEKEHVYLHRVFEEDGKFYVMFEIFDPVSVRSHQIAAPYSLDPRYNTYPFSRYYSRLPYGSQIEEYANIKYQQAIVAAMEENGQVIWDVALVFENIETDQLQQVSDITVKNERMAIAYKKKDELKWKIVDSGETYKHDTTVNIMMSHTSDILRNETEEEGGITYWKDGVFYIWGYQALKRRLDEGKNDRLYVFYVNKMEMEDY